MRAIHLLACMLSLAACSAPPAGDVSVQPTPYGRMCSRPCAVRVVNKTSQTLELRAAAADGMRIIGTVEPNAQRVFGETVLAPGYQVVPLITPSAHGTAAASPPAPVNCSNDSPRPEEDVLLVCS